jgi:hypothetical protein
MSTQEFTACTIYFCIFEIFCEAFSLTSCTVQQLLQKKGKCFLQCKSRADLPPWTHWLPCIHT